MLTTQLILSLLLILVVAWILSSIFTRFGLQNIPGQILAGLLLGLPVLGLVAASPTIELLSAGIITESLLTEGQFSALLFMAFITTFMAPLTLRWAVVHTCKYDDRVEFCQLWDKGKTLRD